MSITLEKFLRRALAVAAVGAVGVTLAGCSLLGNITGGGGSTPGPTSTSGGGGVTDVFAIKVGDCLNDGSVEGEVSEVPIVPCAEPHDSEAYESVLLDDGDFPGEDEVISEADDICFEAFSDFIGVDYDDSKYDFSYYYPTQESWDNGDREVLCLVVDPDGKVTGSLEGARE